MNIENELFKRTKIDFKKLERYGFIKEHDIYKCSKEFMDHFRADITIDEKDNVSGKVIDIRIDDEYIQFKVKDQVGAFANKVREEYEKILKDIIDNCCEKQNFITEQANKIATLILNEYHDKPEFVWDKFPGYGLFRNPNNKKWYALIANVDKSKLDKKCFGEVEILNVKLDEEKIPDLLKQKGFYPAYHMNKKKWITILLDDTLKDEEIMQYIKESYDLIK